MRSSSCCGVATKAVTNQMHGVLSIPAFQEPWHDRPNGHTYPKMDLTKNTCFTCTISGWNYLMMTEFDEICVLYRLYPFATFHYTVSSLSLKNDQGNMISTYLDIKWSWKTWQALIPVSVLWDRKKNWADPHTSAVYDSPLDPHENWCGVIYREIPRLTQIN